METDEDIVKANLEIIQAVTGELTARNMNPTPEFILAIYENVCKDRRMVWIQNQRSQAREQATKEPATERQKKFMDQLHITYAPDITKSEASKLIDEKIPKK